MASTRPPRAEHLRPVLRRAARAKLAIAAAGALTFAATLGVVRRSYAGHPKRAARPLVAPQRFQRAVRSDLLRGGAVAPPTPAPPQAQTSAS